MTSRTLAFAVVAALALTEIAVARVKVTVEFDKAFDFTPVKTWGWNPKGPGELKMARTPKYDDPEAMKKKAEPWILDAVAKEMTARGLQQAAESPHITVTYYMLLTMNLTGQQIGQFLPSTMQWGLPYFPPATQSLEMMNQGSFVLDLSASGTVVWRGLAQSDIKVDTNDKKRESLVREAVRDLLKKFPPKK